MYVWGENGRVRAGKGVKFEGNWRVGGKGGGEGDKVKL